MEDKAQTPAHLLKVLATEADHKWGCDGCDSRDHDENEERFRCDVCDDFDFCRKCNDTISHEHHLTLCTGTDWYCSICHQERYPRYISSHCIVN